MNLSVSMPRYILFATHSIFTWRTWRLVDRLLAFFFFSPEAIYSQSSYSYVKHIMAWHIALLFWSVSSFFLLVRLFTFGFPLFLEKSSVTLSFLYQAKYVQLGNLFFTFQIKYMITSSVGMCMLGWLNPRSKILNHRSLNSRGREMWG